MDLGRIEELVEALPTDGRAFTLRRVPDGWEVGWIGGMTGGEFGVEPTLAEAIALALDDESGFGL